MNDKSLRKSKSKIFIKSISSTIGGVLKPLLKLSALASFVLLILHFALDNISWLDVFKPLLIYLGLELISSIFIIIMAVLNAKFGKNFYLYNPKTDEVLDENLEMNKYFSKKKLLSRSDIKRLSDQLPLDLEVKEVTEFDFSDLFKGK